MTGGISWPLVEQATSTAPAFSGGEADLFHQRDGEGAGGDHVGDGRAGDQAGQPGGDHGGLGRSAAQMAQPGKGGADKVVAGAGRFQQGAEEHEHEDHAGGNPQGDAEDPLGGQPVVGHALGQAGALVGDDVRHVGPAEGVDDKDGGHHHQGRAQRAAGGLQQHDQADDGDDQVHAGGQAGPVGQFRVEEEKIGRTKCGHQGHDPVLHRNVVPRRGFEGRIGRVGQKHGKGQVNGPGFGVVEHQNVEQKRQGRGIPELKQRPEQGHEKQDFLGNRAGGIAGAGFGLGNQRIGIDG